MTLLFRAHRGKSSTCAALNVVWMELCNTVARKERLMDLCERVTRAVVSLSKLQGEMHRDVAPAIFYKPVEHHSQPLEALAHVSPGFPEPSLPP